MSVVAKYILSIVCASIFVSIALTFCSKNPVIGSVIKLLSGLYLAITFVSPLLGIRFEDITTWFDYMQSDGHALIVSGEEMTEKAIDDIIIEQTTTYILDKAATLKISPNVEVILSDDGQQLPCSVVLSGDASPYAKQKLQKIITDDLGIAKEYQKWE